MKKLYAAGVASLGSHTLQARLVAERLSERIVGASVLESLREVLSSMVVVIRSRRDT